ncbi:MAG: hypothetical protein KGD63_12220 [Candidatus Lokiarchaeota archaeon]|nr:hypothetical protein [Candidatus Lokiarchaeota archaeon]
MEYKENIDPEENIEEDYIIDFITSSAISRMNLKFLIVYIPIFWFSGILTLGYWWTYQPDYTLFHYAILFFYIPLHIIAMFTIFTLSCVMFSKLILIVINLIHKPKQGIFYAEKGDHDFEFWCLRIEIKKLVMWLMNNWPLPYIDILVFRWFGTEIDFSSHLQDSWCDLEFVKFGRRVMVGQGAVVMSSMVIGKYLIIKEVILDDYAIVGGMSAVAPGTIFGKESMTGAFVVTAFDQILDPGWIYIGIPARKFKHNIDTVEKRAVITKKNIDEEEITEVKHEINIDEDKKSLI